MGGLLSKINKNNSISATTKSTGNTIIQTDVQSGPSGYIKPSRFESATTTKTNSRSSSDSLNSSYGSDDEEEGSLTRGGAKRELSIVSLVSTESSTSYEDGESSWNGSVAAPGEDGGELSLTDFSKLGATCIELSGGCNDGGLFETEQERLFREEQEHLEKETQQRRAKTARLKRRSELYGGSGAGLLHGANGVKSAESVIRLIELNTSGPSLVLSSSRSLKVKSYVAPLPLITASAVLPPQQQMYTDSLDSQNNSARSSDEPASSSLPLIQPGSHRGVSRIRDDNNEAKMVSRSAQYMRNVNNRTVGMGAAGSQDAKKISPLVTQSDLSRAVQHSPSQGIRRQMSSWRLVPLHSSVRHTANTINIATAHHRNNITKYKASESLSSNNEHSADKAKAVTKLPACNSRNRAGMLLEGNLTMNKIERFLETRDHIDKTDFDVVVRNLVEQQTTPPADLVISQQQNQNLQQLNQTTSNIDHPIILPECHTRSKQHSQRYLRNKITPTNNNKLTSNSNENRFVSAPYHPNQSRYFGKNKFFEPAAYAHFLNGDGSTVSSSQRAKIGGRGASTEGRENRLIDSLRSTSGANSSKSSMESERSEKRDASSPAAVTDNSQTQPDPLIATFNLGNGGAIPKTTNRIYQTKQHDSFQRLPPVSSVPLVTRSSCLNGGNGGLNNSFLPMLGNDGREDILLHDGHSDDTAMNRPQSREWLQKRSSL